MGKRDTEEVGAYLLKRMRGEAEERLPQHREAAELACAADAVSLGYERLAAEGDEQGSKYALMRKIERDMAVREDREMRRSWVFSFAAATACTVERRA